MRLPSAMCIPWANGELIMILATWLGISSHKVLFEKSRSCILSNRPSSVGIAPESEFWSNMNLYVSLVSFPTSVGMGPLRSVKRTCRLYVIFCRLPSSVGRRPLRGERSLFTISPCTTHSSPPRLKFSAICFNMPSCVGTVEATEFKPKSSPALSLVSLPNSVGRDDRELSQNEKRSRISVSCPTSEGSELVKSFAARFTIVT
mmetsp:Transcript_84611/g.240396  ORF Transcript_84611/g.240396 Transcript_84611/m.240396 type:complete len:203 (-) Transcript_84611:318-926(-)